MSQINKRRKLIRNASAANVLEASAANVLLLDLIDGLSDDTDDDVEDIKSQSSSK